MATKKASSASSSKGAGFPNPSTGENLKASSAASLVPISGPIGQVTLTNAQIPPGASWFRAFVATDSRSPLILATLAETRGVPFTSLYCGARNYRNTDGILITLFVPFGIPADSLVVVTLMQVGAVRYAPPVYYPGL